MSGVMRADSLNKRESLRAGTPSTLTANSAALIPVAGRQSLRMAPGCDRPPPRLVLRFNRHFNHLRLCERGAGRPADPAFPLYE